jgi:hypothetical protein
MSNITIIKQASLLERRIFRLGRTKYSTVVITELIFLKTDRLRAPDNMAETDSAVT